MENLDAKVDKNEAMLKRIMQHSHEGMKAFIENMKALYAMLEGIHRDKAILNVAQETKDPPGHYVGLGKRTKASLKEKFVIVHKDLVILKDSISKLSVLEEDAAKFLKQMV